MKAVELLFDVADTIYGSCTSRFFGGSYSARCAALYGIRTALDASNQRHQAFSVRTWSRMTNLIVSISDIILALLVYSINLIPA